MTRIRGCSRRLRGRELKDLLSTLSNRERTILELRYGLNGSHARTLEAVARALGVTRGSIREIEVRALAKLERAEGDYAAGSARGTRSSATSLPA